MIMMTGMLAGCTTYDNFREAFFGGGGSRDTIKIGVYEPSTGDFAKEGKLEIQGIELANKLYPEILGKKVELVYADTGSDLDIARTAAKDLMMKDPAAVLGSYGSVFSMLGGKYFAKNKVPAIAATNTNPLVTLGNPYYFRVCFVEAYQGEALAKFTMDSLKVKKAAVMMPADDDQATAVSDTYSQEMISGTDDEEAITTYQEYEPGSSDFGRKLKKIAASGAKTVFLPGAPNDAVNIMTQAEKMGLDLTFLGTTLWEDDDFKELIASEKLDNVYFSAAFDADTVQTDETKVFLKAYKKEYDSSDPDQATALGFDAYLLAADAISKAGSAQDGSRIAEALRSEKNFKGASGYITFDDNGDPERSVTINGTADGKIAPVYVVKPESVLKKEKEN
mgnify:CR=1 FL=1